MAQERELPPPRLCCGEHGSFAHKTARERHPAIITVLIDHLSRRQFDLADGQEREDGKRAIARLSHLKYCLWTNKPIEQICDDAPDADVWKTDIDTIAERFGEHATYFGVPWLFEECYLYRRIRESLWLSPSLRTFDPFAVQKEEAWRTGLETSVELGQRLEELGIEYSNETLSLLVQVALWGNKSDLSLFRHIEGHTHNTLHTAHASSSILVDDSERLSQCVSALRGHRSRIDIILDNAAFELFTDLCLADWLVRSGCCSEVVLHVKNYGWFVSDATSQDVHWLIEQMKGNKEPLSTMAERWSAHIENGAWTIREHWFWTTWHDYAAMGDRAHDLYADLQGSALVLLKGDLNYRKLLGDRHWPYDTAFAKALGAFHPSPLCALRTNKAELIVGVPLSLADETARAHPDWLTSGNFGVIQFLDRVQ